MKQRVIAENKGFTIVELLIVVVVIAILAAITIVSYNGISRRAQVAAVQSDLRNIAQQMELFFADNNRYPNLAQQPLAELEQVLRGAGLYQKTRGLGNEAAPKTTFVFCRYSEASRYLVASVAPLLGGAGVAQAGKTFYYISSQGGLQSAVFTWDDSITGNGAGGRNVCKSADPSFLASSDGDVWSFHVPISWAP